MISGGYNKLSTKLRWKYLLSGRMWRPYLQMLAEWFLLKVLCTEVATSTGFHSHKPSISHKSYSLTLVRWQNTELKPKLSLIMSLPSKTEPILQVLCCLWRLCASTTRKTLSLLLLLLYCSFSLQLPIQKPAALFRQELDFVPLAKTNKQKPQPKQKKPHQTVFAFKSCCMHFFKKILLKIKISCKLLHILCGRAFNQRSYGIVDGSTRTLHSASMCNQVNWRSKWLFPRSLSPQLETLLPSQRDCF